MAVAMAADNVLWVGECVIVAVGVCWGRQQRRLKRWRSLGGTGWAREQSAAWL